MIFNIEKTAEQYENVSLFGNGDVGLLDTVNKRFEKIFSLYKEMKALDWDELEFDFSQCLVDFEKAPTDVTDMMIKTIMWQWESDSVASQCPAVLIAPYEPCTELWEAELRINDNECFSSDTEVLTDKGFKLFSELLSGKYKVAQYENGAISFVNYSNFFTKKYEGKMFGFKNTNNHFNQLVTPNHRMIARKNSTGEMLVSYASDFDYKQGTSGDLISGIVSGLAGTTRKLTNLERFLIAVQADGSISDRYDGSKVGTVPVRFSFSKERKINRLLSLCGNLGFNIRETTPSKGEGNVKDSRNFYVDVPVAVSSKLKTLDWVDFEDIAVDFLDEVVLWDGHFAKNTGILNTTCENSAKIVQTVAVLLGYKTHHRVIKDSRKETYSDIHRVSWKKSDYVSGQRIFKTEHVYSGDVYCVTVPSGMLVTRREGAVSISGNSIHANTYSEIVRMGFPVPQDVLRKMLKHNEAHKRLSVVGSKLKELKRKSVVLAYKKEFESYTPTMHEICEDMILFYFIMYCLERVQFMDSFGTTFIIAQSGWYQAIGQAVKKICQDEFEVHSEYRKEVLLELIATPLGKEIFENLKPILASILEEVVDSEIRWTNEDLFENDTKTLVGTNSKLMVQWCLFNAKAVANTFGLKTKYVFPKSNPIPILEDWINMNKQQSAPQEIDNPAYKVNAVDVDDEDVIFKI